MQQIITAAQRNLTLLLLAALFLTGCGKGSFNSSWSSNFSSSSDWTINGRRTISRTDNGVTRKLETTTDVEIQNGQVTKFPKAALVKMLESGGPEDRQAELRENAGSLDLWIKDKESFRRGSPEDETWRESFLSEIIKK